MRRTDGLLLAAALPSLWACGGGRGRTPDAGDDVVCGGLHGSWAFEEVTRSSGTFTHDGDLATTASGTAYVAYSEPAIDPIGDQNIYVSARGASAWGLPLAITRDTGVNNAFASLVADGDALHLVWSGAPAGRNDVFYSTSTGAAWSARENLTLPFETTPHDDVRPVLAIGPGGAIAVAYLSNEVQGDLAGPASVMVARLESGAVLGDPEIAVPATDAVGCFSLDARFDAAGHLHVVAECAASLAGGTDSGTDLFHATDKSGGWTTSRITSVPGASDVTPALALDPDGATLHLTWEVERGCGGGLCHEVWYAHGIELTGPVRVDADGGQPSVIALADGRVVIGFSRRNPDLAGDVYLTSSGGDAFAPPCRLTPDPVSSDEHPKLSVAADGALELLYQDSTESRLDADLIFGRLAAP